MEVSGRKLMNSGQTTIEFILGLVFILGFFVFYAQLCFIMAWGNYVHYATFMAARAYLSSGPNRDDQVRRAKDVIINTLKKSALEPSSDRLPMIAKAIGAGELSGTQINPPQTYDFDDISTVWMQGVRYSFSSTLLFLGGRGPGNAPPTPEMGRIDLTSESWLGKEPSEEECLQYISSIENGVGEIDNGC